MVNTFVLHTNIKTSFELLDWKRLGKQRLEAKQLIDVLKKYDKLNKRNGGNLSRDELVELARQDDDFPKGWAFHPCTLSWIFHTKALKAYYNYCLDEWIARGYQNNMPYYDIDHKKFRTIKCKFKNGVATFKETDSGFVFPKFCSFPPFIYSHRAALYMKDEEYYDYFKDTEGIEEYMFKGYFWPCNYDEEKVYRKWKFKYLEPLGTGVPSKFRLDIKLVKKWNKNRNINPETGREITETGAKYKDYLSAYNAFKKQGLL